MNKKLLFRINILLGVVSLWLAGCHSSKSTPKEPERPMMKYGVPEVRALYGVVWPDAPQDTVSTPQDTTVMEETKPVDEREIIVVKYGIPGMFR